MTINANQMPETGFDLVAKVDAEYQRMITALVEAHQELAMLTERCAQLEQLAEVADV